MNIIEENWSKILNHVRTEHELSDISFNTWLMPLKVHSFSDDKLTILVSSNLQKAGMDYISRRFMLPLRVSVAEITGIDCEISFVLPGEESDLPREDFSDISRESFANLKKDYTFDNFVVGSNNQFAHAASLAVAESPGEIYNPLFLYSGVGLGKTHLMQSIAHFILQHNPSMKVRYVTSEVFTNELIEAIRNGSNRDMIKFREKYRNVDVLLIDDVQFIIGKESTQEEFFHTFNTLHDAKKQIIISSDRPPKDMEILEDRIRSRFEWGLICDISQPDFETRMAILKKKQDMEGYQVSNEVIQYIASNIKSNIRELEGALTKIKAYALLVKKEITLSMAEEVLKDIISPDDKKQLTPEGIINIVADHFEVTPTDIISNKRNSRIVYPRQICMYLMREVLDIPLTQIGANIGNRDHSTVIYGIDKIEEDLKHSDQTKNNLIILRKKLGI